MTLSAPHTFAANEVATASDINKLAGWYAKPRLDLDNTGNLTALATATVTAVTFSDANENVDSDAMHSGTTNPTRITVASVGFWRIRVRVSWGTATTGTYRACQLFKSGAFLTAQSVPSAQMAAAACNGVAEYVFTDRATTVGDYYEVKLAQDTGGSVSPVVKVQAVWEAST